MLLVITGVGFLIHAYSVGYMDGDPEEKRFFAYLNLFVFSMLLLVLAGNFVFLLAGWGLVGLSSYLLIGFWWQRPSAVAAAKKAFIMNAIGDVGMTLGIFVIWNHLHTVDYATAFALGSGPHRRRLLDGQLDRAPAAGRRRRQVGAAAAADLAAGRDGGPDAGLGADPRRHDGHRRRLPGRAHVAVLLAGARRLRPRRDHRRRDAHRGGADRARADRHQARDRLLDDVADRLHVLRRRHRRVLGRHVPPRHARVLQGAPVPRRRRRHPRPPRRAGHPQDGRPEPATCRTRPA